MPADLLTFGVLVLSWGATYLVHSTLLVAGAWVFLKIRRDAGHWLREMIWKTALVGGLATASAQMLLLPAGPLGSLTWMLPDASPQSVDSDSRDLARTAAIESRPGSDSGMDLAARSDSISPEHEIWFVTEAETEKDAPGGSRSTIAVDVPAGVTVAGRNSSATGAEASFGRFAAVAPWLTIVVLALVAVAFGMLRSLWQTLALSRKLAACTPLDAGPAREMLDDLCRLIPRAPPIRLLVAADHAEPAALGVRQWTIVLPRRAVADLPADELRSLLAHELAHLVRGDAVWLCVSRFVCSCLAFQPLNHLARREWQRAAEFLCDTWAVRRTGSPLALARCLTEVASWRLAAQSSAASLAATGRKSGLVHRIERLIDARPLSDSGDDRRNYRRVIFCGGMGLVLLAWCAPRVIVIAAATESPSTASQGFTAESAPKNESESSSAVDDEGSAPAPTDVAELPPAGEPEVQQIQPDVKSELPEAGPRASNARAPAMSLRNISRMLTALDRDLASLESELREIEPLLRDATGAPQAARLAARLNSEIASLKQRRELLKVRMKSVGR